MFRRLQDPFQTVVLPEKIDDTLTAGPATCLDFSRRGNYLAAGCSDGQIIIYDFDTRGVHRRFKRHTSSVACVTWARSGFWLASATDRGEICVWDVLQGEAYAAFNLQGRISCVSLSRHAGLPGRPASLLISFSNDTPIRVDLTTNSREPVPTFVPASDEAKVPRVGSNLNAASEALAVFDKRGRFIFMAQSRGTIAVLHAESMRFIELFKVPGVTRITSFMVDRKGEYLIICCQDRTVRLFEVNSGVKGTFGPNEIRAHLLATGKVAKGGSLIRPEDPMLKQVKECSIPVEKVPWQCALLSNDQEHILAAPQSKEDHSIYVWARDVHPLTCVLKGPKTGVSSMVFHPYRNILVSLSTCGEIYIWQQVYRENWSAFAPDFQELTQNEEYDEAEDEFDINTKPGTDLQEGASPPVSEDDVDVVTVEDIGILSSDDEDDQISLQRLPAEVIPEPTSSALQNQEEEEEEEEEEEPYEEEGYEEMPSTGANSLDADEEMAEASDDEMMPVGGQAMSGTNGVSRMMTNHLVHGHYYQPQAHNNEPMHHGNGASMDFKANHGFANRNNNGHYGKNEGPYGPHNGHVSARGL